LAERPIPTTRQVSSRGPPPQLLRDSGQPLKLRGGADHDAAKTGLLQSVPQARLVVMPATSHIGLTGQADVLVPLVTAFLDDMPPVAPDLF